MINEASKAVTNQIFAYQPFKQLTLEALPIQLVLFEHWAPNYHASAIHASVILNEQWVPMACQQVVTRLVAQRKVVKAN